MDKYNHFGVEDLVWDPLFRQWVLAPTRETEIAWNNWMEQNPDASDKIMQAREIVRSLQVVEPSVSDEEISKSVTQTVSRLNRPANGQSISMNRRERPLYKTVWFRVAASVAILLVAGWFSRSYFQRAKPGDSSVLPDMVFSPEEGFVTTTNTSDGPMRVVLADKSEVILAANSYIRYQRDFVGKKREVYLEGEAFFEVTKNTSSPFFVYANELVTKVLGTSFTIRAFESSSEVTVEVKTGRVSVFANSDANLASKTGSSELSGLILLPNQKIVFKRDEVRMVKTLVEKPEIILPKAEVPYFTFEDTPVSEVFESIEHAYGIDILYDAEILKDCPLTAVLDNQPLNEKLTIICKAVEATYEILDGQIVIHSKGCKN